MGDVYVGWTEYHALIERLALRVYRSAWEFDQIVCIARGGLRVGDTLSRIFKRPLAIIFTQSYTGEAGTVQGKLKVAEHLTMTSSGLGRSVLLVDDLVDSGVTLEVVQRHLLEGNPTVRDIRTAVLWYKGCSRIKPDYHAVHLPESPWIHQPFEPYDTMAPESLPELARD
jgi:hypoxanthine phosphoribosyltransferase